MTCTLAPGANLASVTVGASSPTPQPRTEGKARHVTTKPLGGATLSALGVRNRYMMRVLERIAATFDNANVPLLALKGAFKPAPIHNIKTTWYSLDNTSQ